jgi:hypothetical protein
LQLREHVRGRGFLATFRLHTMLSRGGEVDDGVDSIRSDAQFEGQFDVPAAERIDEGIDFASGGSADPILNPIAIGNGNYAAIGRATCDSRRWPGR